MKLYVPAISDAIILTNDWKFTLHDEYRNESLYSLLTNTQHQCSYGVATKAITATLPKGTVLSVDRIYIRRGQNDFNSITFIVKKAPFYKKGKIRFWVKLKDANNIEFEPYEP